MNPDQWKRIDELLDAAFELAPENRSSFLDEACAGDNTLKEQIQTLLEWDDRGRNLLETPAVQLRSDFPLESQLSAGDSIGVYKILSLLGQGGMGEVYLALDTRLNRNVAIKFLPTHLSDQKEIRQRFEREARAISSLSNPNICSIFDIGQQNGANYLVMEYIEGNTLATLIQEGMLPLNKTMDIAVGIADGLSAAHRAGVIHRDLKPANVMITTEGRVKILDFGLAKLPKTRDEAFNGEVELTTRSGVIQGTVPYMSPEQASGTTVDYRSDQFSFGLILYEMITGTRAFVRKTAVQTLAAIISDDPIPLSDMSRKTPALLCRIVERCLSKDVNDRFESTFDLYDQLRHLRDHFSKTTLLEIESDPAPGRISASAAKPVWRTMTFRIMVAIIMIFTAGLFLFYQQPVNSEKITIAVVDFINETGDHQLNGLSGLLITDLEQSGRIKVLTRTRMIDILRQINPSQLQLIDEQSGRTICNFASVPLLAIGTIKKFGDVYTIDLKVVDADKDEHLFAVKANGRGKESIPSLIDLIAERMRSELKEPSDAIRNTNQQIAQVTTTSLEAFQHYFQGEQFINNSKIIEASDEFRKAIEIDPRFALAHYRLGYTLWAYGEDSTAIDSIETALKLKNRLSKKEYLIVQAMRAHIRADKEQAFALYGRYLNLYPEDKEALFLLGDFATHHGEFSVAVTNLREVLTLDPTFDRATKHLLNAYNGLQDMDQALELARSWNSRTHSEESYLSLASTYRRRREFDHALQIYKNAFEKFPQNPFIPNGIGDMYVFRNEFEKAEAEFENLIEESHPDLPDRLVGLHSLTLLNLYQGKYNEALKHMDKAEDICRKAGWKDRLTGLESLRAYIFEYGFENRNETKNWLLRIQKAEVEQNRDAVNYLFLIYLALGEYDLARSLIGNPWLDYDSVLIDARIQKSTGNFKAAIPLYEAIVKKSDLWGGVMPSYELAECFLKTGQLDDAIGALKKAQQPQGYNFSDRALYYPRTYNLLGKIYEAKGDRKHAVENYRKFLSLWKEADQLLPVLLEVKARLAKITS